MWNRVFVNKEHYICNETLTWVLGTLKQYISIAFHHSGCNKIGKMLLASICV